MSFLWGSPQSYTRTGYGQVLESEVLLVVHYKFQSTILPSAPALTMVRYLNTTDSTAPVCPFAKERTRAPVSKLYASMPLSVLPTHTSTGWNGTCVTHRT